MGVSVQGVHTPFRLSPTLKVSVLAIRKAAN